MKCLFVGLLAILPSLGCADAKELRASIDVVFDASEAGELARTLPVDRQVRFRLRTTGAEAPSGVLVFISPLDTSVFPESWAPLFDELNLSWIGFDGFGNATPTAQRMLAAMMALKVVQRDGPEDGARVYVAALSGGGRVASQLITRFPHHFSGALYIVGADFFMPDDPLRSLVLSKRFVFLTGSRDFNRREMREVFARYQKAGARHARLLDLEGYRHRMPDAPKMRAALELLDAR